MLAKSIGSGLLDIEGLYNRVAHSLKENNIRHLGVGHHDVWKRETTTNNQSALASDQSSRGDSLFLTGRELHTD